MPELHETLVAIRAQVEPFVGTGRVADYIPALARVDPRKFGLAIAMVDGRTAQIGDAEEAFSLQSVTKAFTLAMALARRGEALWERIGREPSGNPFNSIVQLERENGIPRNPLINAGAMAVCDVLMDGRPPAAVAEDIRAFIADLADFPGIPIDGEVAASEWATGHRNASLAHFMKSFGTLTHDVDAVLRAYFGQCSIAASCACLARAGLFLANRGTDPWTARAVISPALARRINAVMLTCGHYDASGDFAYRVGLPAKSGVGGGILAIVPGTAAIAVWSPGLNASGNSLAGTLALDHIAHQLDWSVF
ncbi:MAG: glutaminase [Alphaproteobacteria bacterium]